MSVITSPELFINMKSIPDVTSKEYFPFFEEEMRKCKSGVTINGVHIPAWVYWNTNHWMIDIDGPVDPVTGFSERLRSKPQLWDNVWDIGEHIELAHMKRMGLLVIGTRQLGKSEFGSSYEGWRGVCFENTQNVIAGLSSDDLTLLLLKLDRGLTNLTPYFKPGRVKDEWDKEVLLGYKTSAGAGDRVIYSQYLIRNLEKGKNTEKLAGPTASSLLLDEAGKGEWLESFIGAKPALLSVGGYRCSPIILATSGSFEKSLDLKRFRDKLDVYNFMQIQVKDHTGKMVSFFPGFRSSNSERKKIRLSTYLNVPKGSELDVIPIYTVKDPMKEIARINKEITNFENKNENVLAKKTRMYYPEDEEQLFLTDDSNNIFADLKEMARQHLTYLQNIEYFEEYGWLKPGINGPVFEKAKPHERPMGFPMKEHESKDAPIIIWDHPIDTEEYGILHVGGTDPYNQEESAYSPSLGVTYIYRRTYDPLNGRFQERIVAGYAARPNNMNKWYEQTKLLLEYYKATDLPENENREFIRYFDERMSIHLLEDGIDLAKEINPNTSNKRQKGLSAATPNQKYGNGLVKNYCMDTLDMGYDPNGQKVIKPGIIRIPDKALLQEIIEFVPDMNVDRIVAFRHALILKHSKDKYYKLAKVKKEQKERERPSKTIHTPFSTKKFGAFSNSRRRIL
jgi:hypothetical protein